MRRLSAILLHGLAYLGLCILTAVMWLPMRYLGVIVCIAVLFEAQFTAQAADRGDIHNALLFGAALIATIMLGSMGVWLRAWILRAWDSVTFAQWVWRW